MDDHNFYDEITSLIPPPGDYSLDDIDEILRSTETELENSNIDFNTFIPHNFDIFNQSSHSNDGIQNDVENAINFTAYPSPSTSSQSSCTPPYKTQRTLSTSSMDIDNFNPDDFLNFHDEAIKMHHDFIPTDDIHMKIQEQQQHQRLRNTPSPTESCGSSSGSSTSGIQSDVSSISSLSQLKQENKNDTFIIKNEKIDLDLKSIIKQTANGGVLQQANAGAATIVPLTLPILPATATVQLQPVQSIGVVQGTLIPVKTVPLTSIAPINNLKAPIPVKVEPKIAPKIVTTATTLLKNTVAAKSTTTIAASPNLDTSATSAITTTAANVGKFSIPPTNSKPKTIFLSSNDFKALIQKMNANSKGAKITGGINSQMPKIIMKTPNGKIITANKIDQPIKTISAIATTSTKLSSSPTTTTTTTTITPPAATSIPTPTPTPTPTTIINNTKTLTDTIAVLKPNQQKLAIENGTNSIITTSKLIGGGQHHHHHNHHNHNHHHHHNIFKGMIDEKMYKKQQRMIKNRESASLSRKKKKEYVSSLESRISNLEKENCTLKAENSSLRSQLVALAQTCHCKNSNVGEFILNSLNCNPKLGNEHAQHVRIAPKPPIKSLKQRMIAANVKKNVAVLFAMAFMVTLNVGNFQNYLNKNTIENSIETMSSSQTAVEENVANNNVGGRRLLWVESENEYKEKLNRSKRQTEMEVPPLHFLTPINRNNTIQNTTATINATTSTSTATSATATATENTTTTAKCSINSNYTENLRLASNLHKWIDGNDYLNLSIREKYTNDDDFDRPPPVRFKLTPDYFELKSLERDSSLEKVDNNRKRKIFIDEMTNQYERKTQKKIHTQTINNNDGIVNENDKNTLEIFKPKLNDEYVRLFKGIKRRDDTFYVLSFNMDHILLPASAYNKSTRPKMSLMLPAGDPSLNGDIVLMQIDCEVVNTTELEIKSHMIPEKLRPTKYDGNFNMHTQATKNEVLNNETGTPSTLFKDVKFSNETVDTDTEEELKVKPGLKTYFMTSPRMQAMKKKATILKIINNNGGGIVNANSSFIKNSTLFSKMKDTIEFGPLKS